MATELFANQFRIQSVRANWHDYNGGAYFITICTQNKEHYFGEIAPINENPQIELTPIGEYTKECIHKIETLHNGIFVPLYVIMPNHIHLIVIIDNVNDCRDDAPHRLNIDNDNVNNDNTNAEIIKNRWKSEIVDEKMQKISHQRGKLSNAISGFKSAVSKYARQNGIDCIWQASFYDHIIRNQKQMNRIAKYIEDNPIVWYLKHQKNMNCCDDM